MSALLPAPQRGNPQQILASVWQRNLPLVRQRLCALRSAAELSHSGSLTAPVRVEAAEIAHKLAGSLGMFGFPAGSDIAKHLEMLLDGEAPLSAVELAELTTKLEQILAV